MIELSKKQYLILGVSSIAFLLIGSRKRKIGKMIIKQDIDKIKTFVTNTYGIDFSKPTLIGIRSALPDESGKLFKNNNDYNEWNDSAIVISKDSSTFFRCSVDPGNLRENLKVPNGTAQLVPGVYKYKKGFHKGKVEFPCFVSASPSMVKRDGNKDLIWNDKDRNYSGYFGINIHAQFTDGKVNSNSAGCTVLNHGWKSASWKQFYNLLKDESVFNYVLIDAKEIL